MAKQTTVSAEAASAHKADDWCTGTYQVQRAEALRGLKNPAVRALLASLAVSSPQPIASLKEIAGDPDRIVAFATVLKAGLIQAGKHDLHITDAGRRALSSNVPAGHHR